jgi:hypothetical protein
MSNDAMIVHKERIPRLHAAKPVCICPDPIVIDGETFIVRSAACEVDGHGCISMYIPQGGSTLQEKRVDAKRHTQVSGPAQ